MIAALGYEPALQHPLASPVDRVDAQISEHIPIITEQVPPNLCAEIERESARLALVKEQMKTLEAARRQAIAAGRAPGGTARTGAIGPRGAWSLDKELFGWRRFANRREIAGSLGLAPSYDSGDSRVDQGISKTGNRRARALLVELAWKWLSLQPTAKFLPPAEQRLSRSGERWGR